MSIQEGVEYELRIFLVVAYLSLIGESFAFLGKVQTYGVNADTVVVKGIDIALSVDSCMWRCGQIQHQFLEFYIACVQEISNRIVAFALYV